MWTADFQFFQEYNLRNRNAIFKDQNFLLVVKSNFEIQFFTNDIGTVNK